MRTGETNVRGENQVDANPLPVGVAILNSTSETGAWVSTSNTCAVEAEDDPRARRRAKLRADPSRAGRRLGSGLSWAMANARRDVLMKRQ